MATVSLRLASSDVLSPFYTDTTTGGGVKALQKFRTIINKVIGGANKNAFTVIGSDLTASASGTVTIASGSGTITATINGVAIAITWATSDTNSATLLKNAINASSNALVAPFVTATSALGVVTITALNPGVLGNSITLTASGTGATASGSGRLTGGTTTTYTYTF